MKRKLTPWQFASSMIVILFTGFAAILFLYLSLDLEPKAKENIFSNPVTREPVSLMLNLNSPDDNILVFDPDLLVAGKTSPGTVLILTLNSNDQILEISPAGDFSKTLKMDEGVNKLTISSFDNSGNNKTEKRTVYYSKEKI